MTYLLVAKPKTGEGKWEPAIRSIFPSHETNHQASTFRTGKKAEIFRELYEISFPDLEFTIVSQCTPTNPPRANAFAPTLVDRDTIGNRFPTPCSKR